MTRKPCIRLAKSVLLPLLGYVVSQNIAVLYKLPHTPGLKAVESFELLCNVSVTNSTFDDRQDGPAVFREDVDADRIVPRRGTKGSSLSNYLFPLRL